MIPFLIYYGKLGSWGKSQIPVKSRTNHPHLMTPFWLAEMMSPIFQTGLSKAPNMWREEYLLFTLSCVDTTVHTVMQHPLTVKVNRLPLNPQRATTGFAHTCRMYMHHR